MTDAARAIPWDRPGGAASGVIRSGHRQEVGAPSGEAEHDDVVGAHDDARRLLHAGSAERRHRRPHECVGRRPHEQEAVTIGARAGHGEPAGTGRHSRDDLPRRESTERDDGRPVRRREERAVRRQQHARRRRRRTTSR